MLDSVARIRALDPAEAAKGHAVSIEAIVTFYNPPNRNLLAHDGREGIFVSLASTGTEISRFGLGTRVQIEGVTQPGGFLPILKARRGRHLPRRR